MSGVRPICSFFKVLSRDEKESQTLKSMQDTRRRQENALNQQQQTTQISIDLRILLYRWINW